MPEPPDRSCGHVRRGKSEDRTEQTQKANVIPRVIPCWLEKSANPYGDGAWSRNRTSDTRIFNPVNYYDFSNATDGFGIKTYRKQRVKLIPSVSSPYDGGDSPSVPCLPMLFVVGVWGAWDSHLPLGLRSPKEPAVTAKLTGHPTDAGRTTLV